MPKLGLTSRDAEKKTSLMSLEVALLFGLAMALGAGMWTVGSAVQDRAKERQEAYEAAIEDLPLPAF